MIDLILKTFSLETIVSFILRLFHGITPAQFAEAQAKVVEAELRYSGSGYGMEKKAWVFTALKGAWPKLADFAVDLLIQMALSYLAKKGAIK